MLKRCLATAADPVAARTLKLLQRKSVTTLDLPILKRKKKPITMVTAYDYSSAIHVDLAGIAVGRFVLDDGGNGFRYNDSRDGG